MGTEVRISNVTSHGNAAAQNKHEEILVGTKPWMLWIISLAVWTFVSFAVAISIHHLYRSTGRTTTPFSQTLGLELSQLLTFALLTPFVFNFASRYPISRHNWFSRSIIHLCASILFALLHVILRGLTPYAAWDPKTQAWQSAVWDSNSHAFLIQWHIFQNLLFLNLVDDVTGAYLPIVLIAFLLAYYRDLQERELRASHLETQLAKARLEGLTSQLQPHFLFNTLHSVSALMLTDVNAADKMIARLSDLLRMSLERDSGITLLSREIEFVNTYLEIEKLRFEDRLAVLIDIASDTLDAEVPHLLLQPMVENAVRHGIARLTSGGTIMISSRLIDGALTLVVRDNGPGLSRLESSRSSGLGLRTTQERLKTLYGDDQSLEMRALRDGGMEVSVRLPFHRGSPS